jgi:hypothetical protein
MSDQVLNFDGVEEAKGGNMTMPGTISTFKIKAVGFDNSTNKGTRGMNIEFVDTNDGSSFKHTFWLSQKALTRVQHLVSHACKQKLQGQVSEPQLKAMLENKILPLKVTAQITSENKVYPDLSFGSFTADDINELSFTSSEREDIERGKALRNATPDKEQASVSAADDF